MGINLQKINLKRLVKHMVFFQINLKKITMIVLDMQPLKMVAEVKVGLEVLAVLVVQIFQIFLKIFLGTSVEVGEEVLEDVIQITEGQI